MEHRDDPRAAAIDRITNKREVKNHALVIGLALHARRIYGQQPISEDDIIDEMHRPGAPPNRATA